MPRAQGFGMGLRAVGLGLCKGFRAVGFRAVGV